MISNSLVLIVLGFDVSWFKWPDPKIVALSPTIARSPFPLLIGFPLWLPTSQSGSLVLSAIFPCSQRSTM